MEVSEPPTEPPTFTYFKRFLLNTPCVDETVAYLKKSVQTRNSLERQTSSCKLWQLRLMLLYQFGRDSDLFSKLLLFCDPQSFSVTQMHHDTYAPLQHIQKVIEYITTNNRTPERKYTYLYSLIGLNSPIVTPPMTQINSIDQLPMIPYVLYPLCLYVNKPIDQPELAFGMIAHFFTVFRDETDYYLNSSYGSDYVCIPQQTITFLPADFTELCVILGKEPVSRTKKDIADLTHLLTIFFLKNGMRKRVNSNTVEEYPAHFPEWITPDQGRNKEIEQIYIVNKYSYSVGWMQAYDTELDKVIRATKQQGGNRKRKTQMKRKRNNKTKKRRMKRSL